MWAVGCMPPPSSSEEPVTETGVFLPSTSDGSSGTSGGDEGDAGSGSGGATEGDALLPACKDRDPAAKAAMSVTYGVWGKPDIISEPARTIEAECYIDQYSWSAGALHVALDCTQGDLIDQTIVADIDMPEPPPTMLPKGAKVFLSGGWDLTNGVSSEHFILRDAIGRIRLVSLRNLVEAASAMIWPLQLAHMSDVCPWACAGDCAEGGEPSRRDAILLADVEGESVEVLDGHRGALATGKMHYELTVGQALESYVDHTMSFRSEIVIVGTPG